MGALSERFVPTGVRVDRRCSSRRVVGLSLLVVSFPGVAFMAKSCGLEVFVLSFAGSNGVSLRSGAGVDVWYYSLRILFFALCQSELRQC